MRETTERPEVGATTTQPRPSGTGREITPLVFADLEARTRLGVQKYGEPLRAHNGRSALLDAYQEALDLAQYMRQLIEEQDAAVRAPALEVREPTDAEVADACMSYRHDFGLLDDEQQVRLRYEARGWLRAWRKALVVGSAPAPEAPARPNEHPALAVLRRVEWKGFGWSNYGACPVCEKWKDRGHAPDCALDAALRGAGEATGGPIMLYDSIGTGWVTPDHALHSDHAALRSAPAGSPDGQSLAAQYEADFAHEWPQGAAGSPPVEGEAEPAAWRYDYDDNGRWSYGGVYGSEPQARHYATALERRCNTATRIYPLYAAPVPAREGEDAPEPTPAHLEGENEESYRRGWRQGIQADRQRATRLRGDEGGAS